MPLGQEVKSWLSPGGPEPAAPPKVGDRAPETPNLGIEEGKPTVVAFLRHCGCPFAEKTFLNLRTAAKKYNDIEFIAVSHSSQDATDNWIKSIPQYGPAPPNLRVVVDDALKDYAAWGLGSTGVMHAIGPKSVFGVLKLKYEGISNRPTESGSRLQTAGTYAVAGDGTVRWGKPAQRANDIPDLDAAVKALQA